MRLMWSIAVVLAPAPSLAQYDFSFQCGVSTANLPKVVGGRNAQLHEIPWQAHLEIQHHDTQDILQCGGVLLHQQIVLTAAHCVTGAKNVKVTLGDYNIEEEGETETVVAKAKEIKIHPGYAIRERFELDAAAIILDRVINWASHPNIRPVCIPPEGNIEVFTNKTAILSGWGLKAGGRTASILQKGTIKVLPPEECSDGSIYGDAFTPEMLCAGVPNGSVDSCAGDSGGPLVSKARNGVNHELLGLVSWGRRCGTSGFPGVYTKITAIYRWLEEVLAGQYSSGGVTELERPSRESVPNIRQQNTTTTTPVGREDNMKPDQEDLGKLLFKTGKFVYCALFGRFLHHEHDHNQATKQN